MNPNPSYILSLCRPTNVDPDLNLEVGASTVLLDNQPAKHKMSIRPIKKHLSYQQKLSQSKYGDLKPTDKCLVRIFDGNPTVRECWVPASILDLQKTADQSVYMGDKSNDAEFRRKYV